MMCYRDRTYCSAGEDCVCSQDRKLTEEVKRAAREWWGGDDPPIAMSDLCGDRREVKDGPD